jgi:hypothetical protein
MAPLITRMYLKSIELLNEPRKAKKGCPFQGTISGLMMLKKREDKELENAVNDALNDPTKDKVEHVLHEAADSANFGAMIVYMVELIAAGHVCNKQCKTCKVTRDGIL